jgi:hypothetical protein
MKNKQDRLLQHCDQTERNTAINQQARSTIANVHQHLHDRCGTGKQQKP